MMKMLTALALIAGLSSVVAETTPSLGALEANSGFDVRSSQSGQFVRISQPSYTWFDGDTIRITAGEALLNLDRGGSIGFAKGTEASVASSRDNLLKINLRAGAFLYSLPSPGQDFEVKIGDFTLTPDHAAARAVTVSSAAGDADEEREVGLVERLADGNIKVSVKSGTLLVNSGSASRYSVSAGDSIGLIARSPKTIKVQSTTPPPTLPSILIQSPERVGAGDEFTVLWQSPDGISGDYVAIARNHAKADEFETIVSSDAGPELVLTAPERPGDYEIRFIDPQTSSIRRFVYLHVVENPIAGYWWNEKVLGGALAVVSGGVAVYIIADSDSRDPAPVSP